MALDSLDGLYCEEDRFEDQDSIDASDDERTEKYTEDNRSWEDGDDELASMMAKEEQYGVSYGDLSGDGGLIAARGEAVGWILRVVAHYNFSALTAVLAVSYLDRFMSSVRFQRDKPWMSQLAAVACLSLAAKVEETQVPLLIDLQVEESVYVFEAKTIQRMELLILSTLQWKMNPVTPFSYFDHIMRRLGFNSCLHWDFVRICERLLLSVVADSRFVCILPSVIATATMLYVISEIAHCNVAEYEDKLMGVLKTNKEKVNNCYTLLLDITNIHRQNSLQRHKRKNLSVPGSPNAVIDLSLCSDDSNDSWNMLALVSSTSSSEPLNKKNRALDQQTPLNRVSMDLLGMLP